MNEIWLNLLYTVIGAVGLGLAGLIGWGFTELNRWLATKTKNEKLFRATNVAQNLIVQVVQTVQQTFVDQLKKDGKFDKDAQKEALEMAVKQVYANLSPDIMEVLEGLYGDIREWITIQIESTIFNLLPKKEKSEPKKPDVLLG